MKYIIAYHVLHLGYAEYLYSELCKEDITTSITERVFTQLNALLDSLVDIFSCMLNNAKYSLGNLLIGRACLTDSWPVFSSRSTFDCLICEEQKAVRRRRTCCLHSLPISCLSNCLGDDT